MDKKVITSKVRTHALDRASILNRLLDDRYFNDAATAIKNNDFNLWKETCEKADIPIKTYENLWKIVAKQGIAYYDVIW